MQEGGLSQGFLRQELGEKNIILQLLDSREVTTATTCSPFPQLSTKTFELRLSDGEHSDWFGLLDSFSMPIPNGAFIRVNNYIVEKREGRSWIRIISLSTLHCEQEPIALTSDKQFQEKEKEARKGDREREKEKSDKTLSNVREKKSAKKSSIISTEWYLPRIVRVLYPLVNVKGNCFYNAALQLLHSFNPEWLRNMKPASDFSKELFHFFTHDLLSTREASVTLLNIIEKRVTTCQGPQEPEMFLKRLFMALYKQDPDFVAPFGMVLTQETKCYYCGYESEPFRTPGFKGLLPIPLTRLLMQMKKNEAPTLQELLDLDFQQKAACTKCGGQVIREAKLETHPRYLLVNPFWENPKEIYGVTRPLVTLSPELSVTGKRYKLQGGVVNTGGHSIAFVCREKVWFLCDDTTVYPIAEEEALKGIQQHQGGWLLAYILQDY